MNHQKSIWKRKYVISLSTELRKQLSDYFKPFNDDLEELLEMNLIGIEKSDSRK